MFLDGYADDSHELLVTLLGKTIESATLDVDKNRLVLKFTDGQSVAIFDDGQSCCEDRYMRTDDNLADCVGAELLNVEVKDGGKTLDDACSDYCHEIQFLDVTTSRGVLQMVTHNEHNGYYGGFHLKAERII